MRRIIVAVAFASLVACTFIKNENSNQQGQSTAGPTGVEPSPTAQCALVSLDAGTENDATQISRGGTVVIGVSLIGQQGLELSDMCIAQFQPRWAGGAPCILASTGFAGTLSAPLTAPIGSTCVATVQVGGKSDTVTLEVVP